MRSARAFSRKTRTSLVTAGLAALALVTSSPAAQAAAEGNPRRDAFDEQAHAEIAAVSPEAADLFESGTAAADAGSFDDAREAFRKATTLAPGIDHIHRRLCGAELGRGAVDAAVAACRKAVALYESPRNQMALARALLHHARNDPSRRAEAKALVEVVLANAYGETTLLTQVVLAGLELGSTPLVNAAVSQLAERAPSDPDALAVRALAKAASGDADAARELASRAKRAGLEGQAAARVDQTLAALEASHDTPGLRWAARIGITVALVLALLGIVLLLGGWLSRRTLAVAAAMRPDADGKAEGVAASLRRGYRALIGAAAVLFFVALPLVPIVVLGLGGGVLYGFVQFHAVPAKLALLVLGGVVVTFWATLKGAWAALSGRAKNEDEPLRLEAHAGFAEALRDAARQVGTRPVDKVFLEPGTTIAVTEEGSTLQRLQGRGERHLHLGIGVLEGMTVRQLKAILAHEYGHFRNEDTAGGDVALAVRKAVLEMALTLARGGAASPLNPGWHFVRGFHAAFVRVSHGASRLQEILADRAAIHAYGSEAFAAGLRHVIARTITFDARAEAVLRDVLLRKTPLANLYQHPLEEEPSAQSLAEATEKALGENTDPWDSHPSPKDRLAWAAAARFPGVCPASAEDDAPAWSLFSGRAALERAQTSTVRLRVSASHGLRIAAG